MSVTGFLHITDSGRVLYWVSCTDLCRFLYWVSCYHWFWSCFVQGFSFSLIWVVFSTRFLLLILGLVVYFFSSSFFFFFFLSLFFFCFVLFFGGGGVSIAHLGHVLYWVSCHHWFGSGFVFCFVVVVFCVFFQLLSLLLQLLLLYRDLVQLYDCAAAWLGGGGSNQYFPWEGNLTWDDTVCKLQLLLLLLLVKLRLHYDTTMHCRQRLCQQPMS